MKGHDVDYYSISDGGDGFLTSISQNKQLTKKSVYVLDALSNKKLVSYYIDNDKAYIEVAKIIGKNKDNKLDIYNASTYGVGHVILHALKNKKYSLYNLNLTPNAKYATYLGYQTTNKADNALTDIRFAYSGNGIVLQTNALKISGRKVYHYGIDPYYQSEVYDIRDENTLNQYTWNHLYVAIERGGKSFATFSRLRRQ